MADKILFLDGSRKLNVEVVIAALSDIDKIRELEIEYFECSDMIDDFARQAYNPKRDQLKAIKFLHKMHNTGLGRCQEGKLIITDYDLYDETDPDSKWFFGGFNGTNHGLGYITLSTARLQDEVHARDLVRHEAGHMFNAPSKGRNNTYELLGLHCSNDLCVMQQKDTVPSSIKYAHLRARKKSRVFCNQCEKDISEYVVR